MTQNQIEYWKLQEALRHNIATETESERAARTQLRETKRSNKAREAETRRHNVSSESIDLFKASNETTKNEIYSRDVQNRYELGVVGNVLSQATLDHRINYDNQYLTQDWNKAMLSYKSSIYGADSSKAVGMANAAAAQANAATNARRAEYDYLLGSQRNEVEAKRAQTYEDMKDNQFIIDSARNRVERGKLTVAEANQKTQEVKTAADIIGSGIRDGLKIVGLAAAGM